MPAPENELPSHGTPVVLKFEQARAHAVALRREVQAFRSEGVGIGVKMLDTKPVYTFHLLGALPARLALIAGDAIQNLRSCLDHLAYQLVMRDTNGQPPDPRAIYFPVGWSETNYQEQRRRKLPGASLDTLQMIDAMKPFKGGNEALWQLTELSNIDKHRLLLTVGTVLENMELEGRVVERVGPKSAQSGESLP